MIKIAINGFGRIGRLVYRTAMAREDIEVVAINDLVPVENLAYLLKFDSIHGRFHKKVEIDGDTLVVDHQRTKVLQCRELGSWPWKELGVDYVVESTGLFTSKEACRKHIEAGAKRVLISAPAKGEIPTFVMGVNEEKYNPSTDTIISNASCTTNCLAPITRVLLDHFGIEEGLMTTVHATTATQPTTDGPSKKDLRGGRSGMLNIIPAATGAAKAVGLCIPEVAGKLTGMAFRIPLADVSVVDLTVRLSRETSYEEISLAMKEASEGRMKGILCYCKDPVVSTDFIGDTHSSIFDQNAGIALNKKFYKLVAWYDNEMGYATRVVDLLQYIAQYESA